MKEPCVHDFELTDFYSSCLLPLLLMYHALKLQKLSDHIKYYEAVYKFNDTEIFVLILFYYGHYDDK